MFTIIYEYIYMRMGLIKKNDLINNPEIFTLEAFLAGRVASLASLGAHRASWGEFLKQRHPF